MTASTETLAPAGRRQRVEEALAWLLLGIALAPTAVRVARGWSSPVAEHGPVVVAVVAWLVWRSWPALVAAPRAPWPRVGAVGLAGALWVHASLQTDGVETLAAPTALVAVLLLVVARHGPSVAAWLAFPVLFLLFTLPAPGPVLFSLSIRLKLLAAHLACGLLDACGLTVVQVGSTLHLPGASLAVDEACSGLRGLTAIVALGVLQAYLAAARRRGVAALLCAVPIAVLGNTLRVALLSALAADGHEAALEGPLHEGTGLVVYAVAVTLILVIAGPSRPAPTPTPAAASSIAPSPPLAARAGALVVLLAAAVTAALPTAPVHTHVASRLPARLGRFTSEPLDVLPAASTILTADLRARRFTLDPGAAPVDVFVIHAAQDPWRAFHPPESCFMGEGFALVEATEDAVVPGSAQPARRRVFGRAGDPGALVYYWLRLDGRDVLTPLSLRLALLRKSLLGARRFDATFVRLSTSTADGVEAAERRIATFAGEALGPLDAALFGPRDPGH